MAKKKQKNKSNLRRRARRDVRVANQPALNQLDRAEAEAKDQYDESSQTVGTIYDALTKELTGIDFTAGSDQIASDLTQQLSGLAEMLGTSTPAGEQAAAAGMLGNIGGSSLGLLAQGQQRNQAYQQSTQEQAAIERATLRKGMLEDYQDILADISEGRLQVTEDMGPQITARLDELRDRRRAMKQNEEELEIQRSIADRDFGLREKEFNFNRNQTNRSQNAVNRILTDEQREAKAKKKLRKVGNRIENLQMNNPDLIKQDGIWGEMKPTPGAPFPSAFDPNERMNKLVRKRRRIKKRVNN